MVTILGRGGHGRDIAAILNGDCTFLDDDPNRGDPTAYLAGHYLIGVNDPNVKEQLDDHDHPAGAAIHPTVNIAGYCTYGPGFVVGANTAIGPEVTVGRHVHIGAGCTITRTVVGSYTTIGPGVNIGGDCLIGRNVTVGIGSAISNFVTIYDGAILGAGTVVPPHRTLETGTWVGNPARRIG